ncbi:MAG: hypothetical protein ACRC33_08360 [Gemmataceae bacterium]
MTRAIPLLLLLPALAHAGLHYSGETFADLPSRWAGFFLDHRTLLLIARPKPASPLRLRYEAEAARLAALGTLSADEAADLGALYVRLGDAARAVAVLRPAQRAEPLHFRLAANLGTAWHQAGDLTQAAAALEQAARLAPGKHQRAEELHLRLVRLRAREKAAGLDDLFGVDYADPAGVKKLPAAAVGLTQQLSLWLPGDPRLLWQLAELAGAAGDPAARAALLEGCVGEFEMRQPELLAARKASRADAGRRATKEDHDEHGWLFKPRSSRPLVSKAGLAALPAIDPEGVTPLAWEVIAETTVDRRSRPTFHRYLKELDGKRVTLRGHMQPIGEGTDLSAFLLVENPVGCWYCESPELANIVLVELPGGKAGRYTRAALKVTGRLSLNGTDPENFLYLVQDAKIEDGGGE